MSGVNFNSIEGVRWNHMQPNSAGDPLILGATSSVVIDARITDHVGTAGCLALNLDTATANVVGIQIDTKLTGDVDGVSGFKSIVTGLTAGAGTGNRTSAYIATLIGDDNDTNHEYAAYDAGNFNNSGGAGSAVGLAIGTGYTTGLLIGSGVVVYTPSSDQSMSAGTQLTVTSKIMRVAGNGGAVTLTGTPTIVAPTRDGTVVIIQGTSDANTVKFQDEAQLADTDLQLSGGNDMTLGQGDTLTLMYDSGDAKWYEINRSDN